MGSLLVPTDSINLCVSCRCWRQRVWRCVCHDRETPPPRRSLSRPVRPCNECRRRWTKPHDCVTTLKNVIFVTKPVIILRRNVNFIKKANFRPHNVKIVWQLVTAIFTAVRICWAQEVVNALLTVTCVHDVTVIVFPMLHFVRDGHTLVSWKIKKK